MLVNFLDKPVLSVNLGNVQHWGRTLLHNDISSTGQSVGTAGRALWVPGILLKIHVCGHSILPPLYILLPLFSKLPLSLPADIPGPHNNSMQARWPTMREVYASTSSPYVAR